jgi:hypothetical protein
VTQNASDVHHSPSVFDRSNQPAFVMAYVENNEAADNIRISPAVPNLSKVFPIRFSGYLVPSV